MSDPLPCLPGDPNGTGSFGSAEKPLKKKYEAPQIVYISDLEVMQTAVCAPSPPAKGNPGFCPQGPISS